MAKCVSQTISVFNAAVDLFRIFERILSEIHSVPSITAIRSTRGRLVQDLDQELDDWQKSLNSKCAYPDKNDNYPTRSLYLCHAVSTQMTLAALFGELRIAHICLI